MKKLILFIALSLILVLGINSYLKTGKAISKILPTNEKIQSNDIKKEAIHNSDNQDKSDKVGVSNSQPKDDNYSVLVSSTDYNAVISLDKESKEVNVKMIDDNTKAPSSDNYINLSEEDMKYLQENKNQILTKLKEGSLSEKYNLVTDMLEKYDTNLKISDLISIAMTYIK